MRRLPILALLALLVLAAPAPAAAAVQREVRIIGGGLAAPGQFPFAVALVEARAKDASRGVFCGGAVVAPDAIVTAAHCIQDVPAAEVDVVSGLLKLSDGRGQRVRVAKIVPHPEYDPQTVRNDVAVLRLERPVDAPPVTLGELGLPVGTFVAAAGWGKTSNTSGTSDDLRWVRMNVRSTADCAKVYGDVQSRLQLCASSRTADTCQGDSGGPLLTGDGDAARLVGIVSFGGPRCLDRKAPGVYTRVATYREWILEQAGVIAPAPKPARAAVKIGDLGCGPRTCFVDFRMTGPRPAHLVVNVMRKKTRTRKAIDRILFAKEIRPGRWRVRTDLPFGRLEIVAAPVNAKYDLIGEGDVTEVLVTAGTAP